MVDFGVFGIKKKSNSTDHPQIHLYIVYEYNSDDRRVSLPLITIQFTFCCIYRQSLDVEMRWKTAAPSRVARPLLPPSNSPYLFRILQSVGFLHFYVVFDISIIECNDLMQSTSDCGYKYINAAVQVYRYVYINYKYYILSIYNIYMLQCITLYCSQQNTLYVRTITLDL